MPHTRPLINYLLAALHLPDIGPVRIYRWLSHVENIQHLFIADKRELQQIGLSEKEIYAIKNPNWRYVEKDLAWSKQANCSIVTYYDEAYPVLLKELPDAPLVLFVKGNIDLLTKPQIAIVGSRNPTPAGRETATQFSSALASRGFTITSGLALGIDAAAHLGALKVSGPTLAVLGAGLNHIYPQSNRRLADDIAASGALISEFSPGIMPIAKNFPRRNRIISGLSLGVVVVEAAVRSGSLITARFAAEQGREVFAMPGSIHNPLAKGCHELIRQGAKLIETTEDILAELSPLWEATTEQEICKQNSVIDQKTTAFLAYVDYAATSLDTIILRSGLTAGEVSSMLLSLELEGYVNNVPGGYVRIA